MKKLKKLIASVVIEIILWGAAVFKYAVTITRCRKCKSYDVIMYFVKNKKSINDWYECQDCGYKSPKLKIIGDMKIIAKEDTAGDLK